MVCDTVLLMFGNFKMTHVYFGFGCLILLGVGGIDKCDVLLICCLFSICICGDLHWRVVGGGLFSFRMPWVL